MVSIFDIQSSIREIEKNTLLYKEKNFDQRIDAIDFIEQAFDSIEEELRQKKSQRHDLSLLKHRVEKIKLKLQKSDNNHFQRLRRKILSDGHIRGKFKKLVNEYFDIDSTYSKHTEPYYDNLDIFINRLFSFHIMPEQTKDLEPEMVSYQKTPARIVFELVKKCHFSEGDIFVDIGSGLGQVAILVNLLTGITTLGIEFEPAFCRCAIDCTARLNLSGVTFINVDARKADYSTGNVFFMYTPFKGDMMQEVLEMLRKESLRRKIKIITYGPCTAQIASQSWIAYATPGDDNIYKLGIFSSL